MFANNFSLVHLFKTFSIQNQREILRFLIPILNFLLFFALFVHFDCKCAGNGSKKRKIFLCLRI
jgi:hypothetical protein